MHLMLDMWALVSRGRTKLAGEYARSVDNASHAIGECDQETT